MDRLNIIMILFVIICVLSFIFILFLYGAIVSFIYSYDYGIIYFETILCILIAVFILWSKHKLKNVPKYESFFVSKDGTNICFKNNNFKTIYYDLKDIKGAWLFEYIVNGTLMSTYVVLSKTEGSKKIKDDSPLLFIPIHLSTSKKLASIYIVILYYIEKHFPWVNIGYNNNEFWSILKRLIGNF